MTVHPELYECLKDIAWSGGCITYREIAARANLQMGNQADRMKISDIYFLEVTFDPIHRGIILPEGALR
jgi:hypothetical protein